MKKEYHLKLFITNSASSKMAISNLKDILGTDLGKQVKLDVIDVTKKPELAHKYNIIATPTLIRLKPDPILKLVGDLSNTDKILSLLAYNDHY